MRDHRTLAASFADQFAEMFRLIVEAAGYKGLIQLHRVAVAIANRGSRRVPPVFMNRHIAERSGEERIAAAEQVKTRMQLRHAMLVLGLEERQRIHARGCEP